VIKLCSNKFDESLRKFVERKYIEDIDEDHLVFFVMFFVEKYCKSIYESVESKELGRPRLPAKNMLILIIYGYMIKMLTSGKIAEFTRTDSVFKLIMEGINVSRSSVIRYRDYYLEYYPEILSKTLLFAWEYNLTEFTCAAIDGTKVKACNSSFNYITKKDLRRLLIILKNKKYGKNEVKLLKNPAQKFYYNNNMTVEQKISFLEYAKVQMKEYGKKKIPLYDPDARWMLNKKNREEISYNIQTCVDTESQLIMSVYNSQNANDCFELPPTLQKAIENSPVKPVEVLADAGYNSEITFVFLNEENIEGYIYNSTQSRIDKGKRRTNPFSLDNVEVHYEDNYIQCFMAHPFFNKYTYIVTDKKKEEQGLPPDTKRIYVNTEACKECSLREECLSEKQHHKTYTIYGSTEKREMTIKMKTEEAQKVYSKRAPTVESPFGIFKQYYHIDVMFYRGREKIENIFNLYATAYNLNKIYKKLINKLITEDNEYISFVKEKINKYS